ncbi:SET domain-containing protein [Polyplosphaeria fusca]|uniref:SET domain-containing protein n=1 Tax=Polyplosphaeria fusca TaxID=682080 RepID=A0A9P4UWC4_9PLEO|nr:SET domain-containing protein [Polyplosphaeria fusca]
MLPFGLCALLLAFAPAVFADSTPVLSRQSWHESSLSTALFQCAIDGLTELAIPIHEARPEIAADGKSPETFGAWTHQPICTPTLASLSSKLCVYTNASFSNGRGISIFTTPSLAEEFANLPAFRDPKALGGKAVNVNSRAWYTDQLPGKGVGMLASKNLKFHDRVTAYTPALIAHLEDELSTAEREKFFRIAVYQLPDATREAYLQLAYVYGHKAIRVQDIVKANTFQLNVGGQNHLAVFPETSRLNHACASNAQYYLDPSLLTHFVHVTRPIVRGEEITISYTSPLEPTHIRKQHLENGFHFVCTCPRCSAAAATDATLQDIEAMQNALNDWTSSSTATTKLAEKLIQTYRKEGLEGFMDMPYGFAALAYNAVGNAKKAEKYAKQAQEAILMKDGPWTPNMQIWIDLLKDPRKHWSYQRRKP